MLILCKTNHQKRTISSSQPTYKHFPKSPTTFYHVDEGKLMNRMWPNHSHQTIVDVLHDFYPVLQYVPILAQ